MILAHPEQTVVATAALVVVSLAGPMSRMRRRAVLAFMISATAFALVQIWMLSSGVVSSRLVVLGQWLTGSLVTNSGQWPWLLYAYGGMLWAVLASASLWLYRSSTTKGRFGALFGLLAIPFLATFATADGVRVLAPVSALGILALIRVWLAQCDDSSDATIRQSAGATLLWALVLPPVASNWEVGSRLIVAPAAEGLDQMAEPLKEWMLDRFPAGEIPAG